MCGIIGIIGTEEVSHPLYQGLISIQHRGQHSAGIVTSEGENGDIFHLKKEEGLVGDIFGPLDFSLLKGKAGIGNIRYPTIGSLDEKDVQPFLVKRPFQIASTHNGNVTNVPQLKEELSSRGVEMKSDCDSEAIIRTFADALDPKEGPTKENVFQAVRVCLDKLDGAFSEVFLVEGPGLLAFRDRCGVKPLVFGKKGKNYIFASETTTLDGLGFDFIRNVNPGEAVYIDDKLKVHTRQLQEPERRHCMFEWVYFARTDSINEDIPIHKVRKRLGKQLAEQWKEKHPDKEIDLVVPVPDTSRTAAMFFAREIGARYGEGLIKNRYIGRTFIMATQELRETAVKLKLNTISSQIEGKKLAVVDDSIVRGTTSRRIVDRLKEAGADEVHFLVSCPPIRYPCFYGIDMSTRGELAASGKEIEKIREEIGADSLTYQTIEGLKKAIGMENLCMACLNGEYPTGIEEPKLTELEKARKRERIKINT